MRDVQSYHEDEEADRKKFAEAVEKDYEQIMPKEPSCKYNTGRHIILALLGSSVLIGMVTIAIILFNS